MDDLFFSIKNEFGEDQLCKTILTFDTDDYSYVIFATVDEDGKESSELSAMRYELDEDGNMTNFSSIETEEEWDIIEEVFNTLEDEFTDNTDFFTVITDDGEEKVCKIIHRFTLDGYDKSYMFYVLCDDDEDEIFSAAYIENEKGQVEDLIPIVSEDEWQKVEEELQKISKS